MAKTKKTPKKRSITAKEMHRINILSYLRDWNNPWPKGNIGIAKICGTSVANVIYHFTAEELQEIRREGLELRKENSAEPRARVYDSMLKKAVKGSVAAQNSFLDRTEGKVTEKHEVTGQNGSAIVITNMPPAVKTIAEWEKQQLEAAKSIKD